MSSATEALLHPLTSVERTMLMMVYYTVWGKGLGDLGNRFASIRRGTILGH